VNPHLFSYWYTRKRRRGMGRREREEGGEGEREGVVVNICNPNYSGGVGKKIKV
jgi:hypothetical protein